MVPKVFFLVVLYKQASYTSESCFLKDNGGDNVDIMIEQKDRRSTGSLGDQLSLEQMALGICHCCGSFGNILYTYSSLEINILAQSDRTLTNIIKVSKQIQANLILNTFSNVPAYVGFCMNILFKWVRIQLLFLGFSAISNECAKRDVEVV